MYQQVLKLPAGMIFLLQMLVFSQGSFAEIYKWKDAEGRAHFSDRKPESIETELINIDVSTNTIKHIDTNETIKVKKEVSKTFPDVVMYSSASCGYCAMARKYFNDNNVPFEEYFIDSDKQAYKDFVRLGGKGTPLIQVDQETMIRGFNKNALDSVLGIKG